MRSFLSRLGLLAIGVWILPACGGGSQSSGGGGTPVDPPAVPKYVIAGAGGHTIVSRGGTGITTNGGQGGAILVHNYGVSDGFVQTTGAVDTTFAIPNPAAMSLGSNPKTISVNTVMGVGTGLTAASTAILGDDNATTATGLHVMPNVTLTLNPNYDTDNADGDGNAATGTKESVFLNFSDGVLVEGALKTGLREGAAASAAELAITAANIACLPGSVVDVSGSNNPGGVGGSAGPLNFNCFGSVVTRGTILATGGNGDTGGPSFGVGLASSFWGIFNTGPITTSGGAGANGPGGSAGVIYFKNSVNPGSFTGGGAFNSGDLTAVGGSGTTGGAAGGAMNLAYWADSDGPLVISGTVNSSGGDCTGANGIGGAGGALTLNSVGGHVRLSATCISRGGNGAGAGNGGAGGAVQISGNNGGSASIDQLNFDGAFIGGSIDTSGGTGAAGGAGGTVDLWDNAAFFGPDGIPNHSPMYLVGYASFDASGGAGATGGGNGGAITLEVVAQTINGNANQSYQGGMTNSVPLISKGGQGLGGNGGNGGAVFIGDNETTDPTAAPSTTRSVTNSGDITTTGGAGSVSGGAGGSIYIFDRFNVGNSGVLTSSGGAGGTGQGGGANFIRIRSDGPTMNSGVLTANGGDSNSGAGGNGSSVYVDGAAATTTAAINDRGGNSATNTGGSGGNVEIGSWNGVTLSSVSGTVNLQGGAGAVDGNAGIVTVDGIRQTLTAGAKTF